MKDRIYNILLERGYSEQYAKLMLNDLLNISQPLDNYLLDWMNDEQCQTDFSSNGYSISDLQKERGMKYPAALLTMDWLIKEPDNAKRSLTKNK